MCPQPFRVSVPHGQRRMPGWQAARNQGPRSMRGKRLRVMLSEQAAEGEEPRMQGFSVRTCVRPQSGKRIRFRSGKTVAQGRNQRVRVHTLLLPQSRLPVVSALPTRCAGRLPPCTASFLLTKGVTTAFAFVRARIKTKKSAILEVSADSFLRRDSEVSHCEIARTRDGITRSTSCNRLPRPCTY